MRVAVLVVVLAIPMFAQVEIRELIEGQPALGRVAQGSMAYFRFEVPAKTEGLELWMTPTEGDSDQYLAFEFLPTRENYEWRDASFGAACIYIDQPQTGQFFYGLHGFGAGVSSFSTVFVLNGSGKCGRPRPPQLTPGVPASGQVPHQRMTYFRFQVPPRAQSLEIFMTPTNGDPDMYLARGFMPTRDHYQWSDIRMGPACILIPFPQQGEYFYGVYGFGGSLSTFTTVFVLNGQGNCRPVVRPPELVEGVPVRGQVPQGNMTYFRFDIPDNTRSLELWLTPARGSDSDMYLARGFLPTQDNYHWSDTRVGSACISVSLPEAGEYFYGVYGFGGSASIAFSTVFILNAQGNCGQITEMTPGLVTSGQIAQGAMMYHRFHVPANTKGLELYLTPITGDPDAYLAYEFIPSLTRFHWKDARVGPICLYLAYPQEGEYYYGVNGFMASTFATVFVLNQGNCTEFGKMTTTDK